MKQLWIFSVYHYPDPDRAPCAPCRMAVVGPATIATVEAALDLARVSEASRMEIRACTLVRNFVDDRLEPTSYGYYMSRTTVEDPFDDQSWAVAVGPVHAVLP